MSDTERFEIVRSLGRDSGTFVARDRDARRLVVLERVKRGTLSAENAEALLHRARLLASSPHACIERVRETLEGDDTITIVSEFVDGEWLSALKDAKPRPPLEVLLRILLDAMRGLAALLELQDNKGQPVPLVHGALSPESILVTPQGTTIVARFARGVPRLAEARSDAAYIPFEVLRGRRPADERTDVYSVGAMLWESLTGERPLAGMSLAEIIDSATETRVPPARVPSSAPWAEPLAEIAWRALALDPEERQRDLIGVAAEVRRIAGARVADPLAVEEFMKNVGAVVRVRERRASLERGDEEEAPPVSSSQLLSDSDIQVVRMPPIPSQRPKPTPPPLRVSAPPRESAEATPAPRAPEEAKPLPPAPELESVKTRARSDPPIPLPTMEGDRASLEDVMSTPPKLPKSDLPPDILPIQIVEAAPVSVPPKVIVALPSEASEPRDPEKEREAWERRQPTVRPASRRPPRPDAAPPARRQNRSWIFVMLAVTLGFGWWLGRRSTESESSLTTSAHAHDIVPSASVATPSATASVEERVALSPVTLPSSSSSAGVSLVAPSAARPVTTIAAVAGSAPLRPIGSAPPKTVVVLEPNPSPPRTDEPSTAKPASSAPKPEASATAPEKPKSFEPEAP